MGKSRVSSKVPNLLGRWGVDKARLWLRNNVWGCKQLARSIGTGRDLLHGSKVGEGRVCSEVTDFGNSRVGYFFVRVIVL